jgi:hypothetical protein
MAGWVTKRSGLSWETNNLSINKEIVHISWNPIFRSRVKKNPPLVSKLSHVNLIHVITFCSLNIRCTVIHA